MLNRDYIDKAILMASYNDTGSGSDIITLNQAKDERERDYDDINHLILRDVCMEVAGVKVDRLKSNLLVRGVPMWLYAARGLAHAGFKEVAVVGNEDTRIGLEAMSGIFTDETKFYFASEGENPSYGSVLRSGRDILRPSDDEMIFILSADMPTLYWYTPFRHHPALPVFDAIFDLNARNRYREHFPRRYHVKSWGGLRKRKVQYVKEPNCWIGKSGEIPRIYDTLNMLYLARKTSVQRSDDGKIIQGRGAIINETLSGMTFREKLALMRNFTLEERGRILIERGAKRVSKLLHLDLHNYLMKYLMDPIPTYSLRTMQNLARDRFGLNVLFSIRSKDPGALRDVDSYEDLMLIEALFQMADNPREVYPYYDDIERFVQEAMPELKERIFLWGEFPSLTNGWLEQFGLVRPREGGYEYPYYSDETPFLEHHPYDENGNINVEFARSRIRERVRRDLNAQRNFMRRSIRQERKIKKRLRIRHERRLGRTTF